MIKRTYFKVIEKELKSKKITALIGLRQVGKTTLLEYAYNLVKNKSKAIFIKFDDISTLNYFEEDIEFFIKHYIKDYEYIFIDEIQYSKTSGQKLKYIYDTFKSKKIMISGSSLADIAIHSLSYLVGRVRLIQIFPISFPEFIEYKSPEKLKLLDEIRTTSQLKLLELEFKEYLQFGGYPDVILTENRKNKEIELKDIVNTYLLREIKDVLGFENIREFEKVLKRIALCDGSLLNKQNISSELEISRPTFTKIIDVLSNSAILYQLQPFLPNKIKELVKSSKVYLQDLGFKNYLIQNFNSIELRQDKGAIYESFILQAILQQGFTPKCYNFKNEKEVDFIIERNAEIIGFEVKSKLTTTHLTTSIKHFIEKYSPKKLYVLNENKDESIEYKACNVIFTSHMNIFKILENIE